MKICFLFQAQSPEWARSSFGAADWEIQEAPTQRWPRTRAVPVHDQASKQELADALSPKGQGRGQPEKILRSRETVPGEQCQSPKQQGEGQREEGKPVCMSRQRWGWENQPSEARQVRRCRSRQQGLPLAEHSFQASFGLLKTSLRGDLSILPLRNKKPGEGE